jgi:hypothetical protein
VAVRSVGGVTSFLAETYTPTTTPVAETEALVRRATIGTPVRYARSIHVPDDEVCFHLFECAPSRAAVDSVLRAAGIVAQQIMEVQP